MTSNADLFRFIGTHLEQAICARASSAELLAFVVKNKDAEAFSVLTQRHGPEVYRWCIFFLRNKTDADDLFQEVFLTLWQKCSKVRDPNKLDGWLFRIVRNKAFNRLRSRKMYAPLEGHESVLACKAEDQKEALNKEKLEIVMRELGQLRSEYQEAILLTKVQGLTLQAAAEKMGRPVGTVSTYINRGLNTLIEKLRKYQIELSLPALAIVYNSVSEAVTPQIQKQAFTTAIAPTVASALRFMLPGRLLTFGLIASGMVAGAAAIYYGVYSDKTEKEKPVVPIVSEMTVSAWNSHYLAETTVPKLIDKLKELVTKDGTVKLISSTVSDGPIYHLEFLLYNRKDIQSSTLSTGVRWHYHEITGGIRCETDMFCKGNWSHADIDRPLTLIVGDKRYLVPCKQFRECEIILRELKSNPPPLIHPAVKAEIESDPQWRTVRRMVGFWHDPKHPADRKHLIHIGAHKEPLFIEPNGLRVGGTALKMEGDEYQLHSSPGKFMISDDGMTLKGSWGGEQAHRITFPVVFVKSWFLERVRIVV